MGIVRESTRLLYPRVWDLKCLAAVACFVTSNVLFLVHAVQEMANAPEGAQQPNYASYDPLVELDPAYIEGQWSNRIASRHYLMAAALFGSMAWFWLAAPMVQSAWVLSRGGKRSIGPHFVLAGLAIGGCVTELLARLLQLGMTNMSLWMAKDFNMDDWLSEGDGLGWRVLEMIHIVTHVMVLWVDSFEALALFGIVSLMFHSVAREPKFRLRPVVSPVAEDDSGDGSGDGAPTPPPAATRVPAEPTFSSGFLWYGLFVGWWALMDFLADVLRFVDWPFFGRIAMVTNALLGVVFLPVWILCLAQQLAAATERFEREEGRVTSPELGCWKSEGRELS